jgi:NAD(P)-dependent dehydrogenase (short-subunit alcohol dehydrogenase family)
MKAVITGSASGLGLALSDTFRKVGYTVSGYDLKDNRDIRVKETVNQLLEDCKDADLFVNNALDNQVLLLESVIDLWKDQKKTIINISSAVTYYSRNVDFLPLDYAKQKTLLDNMIKLHHSQDQLPFIMNIRPSWFASGLVEEFNQEKMQTQDLANMIVSLYLKPDIRILDIVATRK